MLKTQFRMHQDIRKFPSERFYNGQLLDDESIKDRDFEPYFEKSVNFYDMIGNFEEKEGKSTRNLQEATFTKNLVCHLL